MFLTEIEKDKNAYIEKSKKLVAKYFVEFFGKEYEDIITSKISNTPLFFVDKTATHFKNIDFLIDMEQKLVYTDYFKKCNIKFLEEVDYSSSFVMFLINDIKKQINQGASYKEIKQTLNLIAKNNIKVNENVVNQLKECFNSAESEIEILKKYKNMNYIQRYLPARTYNSFDKIDIDNDAMRILLSVDDSTKRAYINDINKFSTTKENDGSFDVIMFKAESLTETKNEKTFACCIYPSVSQVSSTVFIHELLHSISFVRLSKTCEIKVGFKLKKDNQKKYTYLNEIITEFFAYNISSKMFDNNELPFFRSIYTTSTYSNSFNLLKPFMKTYFNEIKHAFIENNAQNLEKYFGAENLTNLDNLLYEFSSMKENIDTKYKNITFKEALHLIKTTKLTQDELTEKYFACFLKMQNILDDIEKHIKRSETCFSLKK